MAVIYTLGELLVEIMRPKAGMPLGQKNEFIGPFASGAPGIFISTAARLGHQSLIIAGVSFDKFGQNILQRLKQDGVDCSQIWQSTKPSAVAFVAYDEDGNREFIYHIAGTAADDLPLRSGQWAVLRQPDIFHVMGCSLMVSDIMCSAIKQAVQHFGCSEQNPCAISFDPNLRPELLQGRSFEELAGVVMQHCTILLPSEIELLLAADHPIPEVRAVTQIEAAVQALFENYPRLRIIHLKKGAYGSTIYSREKEPLHIPPYPIGERFPVLDPTGAGDSFDAAFVGAVADGLPLEQAAYMAAKAGALNVIALGPMEGDMSLIGQKLLPIDAQWFGKFQ